MSTPWPRLSKADLQQLSGALQAGRLALPFSAVSLVRYLAPEWIDAVVAESQRLQRAGMNAVQLALLLEALAEAWSKR